MRNRWIAAIAFGLILGLSVPVVASHISEPKNPITGMNVQIFKYPDLSTQLACDGTDVVSFDQLRVHVNVHAERADGTGNGLDGEPSEHWNATATAMKAWYFNGREGEDPYQRGWKGLWQAHWTHQNIGPHLPAGVIEKRINLWDVQSEHKVKFSLVITGNESGNKFTHICVFKTTKG